MMQWLETTLGGVPDLVETLRPEASFREFYRVHRGSSRHVAMFAPPEKEDPERFVRLARLFKGAGVPAPEIQASDISRGFVLMEDFGPRHFLDLYRNGQADEALDRGISMLHVMQRMDPTVVPPYTATRLNDELDIFRNWLIEGLLHMNVPTCWTAVAAQLVEDLVAQPVGIIHRDYHCKNLLITEAGSLGIVDFQDALAGPVLYDVASLLRDCYWRFDEPTIHRWLTRYTEDCGWHLEDPWHQFNRTALQRQLKAVGIFSRLHLRDGKSSHLKYIVPVLDHAAFLARESTSHVGFEQWLNDVRVAVHRKLKETAE
jgi:N-acetylmuramate 1-kinase